MISEIADEMPNNQMDLDRLNQDLYFLLVDKTDGEAANKVAGSARGEGINTLTKLYVWFGGSSGLSIQERIKQMMSPSPVKEGDLCHAMDQWKIKRQFGPTRITVSTCTRVQDGGDQNDVGLQARSV